MIKDAENSQTRTTQHAAGGGFLQTILKELSSARLATAVGGIIVLACILGTLLPQGADVQKHITANPGSANLMKFLSSLGLTNVFDVWWFIVLLVFFSLNISSCLFRRLSALLRSGRLGIPGWGFLLTHISVLLILAGAVIRGAVGQKGYIEIREGQSIAHFLTSRGPAKMPFEVHLVKFELEHYENQAVESHQHEEPDTLNITWTDRRIQTQVVVKVGAQTIIHPPDEAPTVSNAFRAVVSRYVPDFVIDMTTREVGTRSEEPRNPAILVSVEGRDVQVAKWLFANHPEFDMLHSSSDKKTEGNLAMRYYSTGGARLSQVKERSKRIKSFKSALQLLEDGKVCKEKTIEVNSPLSYRGYIFYQSGYNPQDLTWSTLQVVKDPGVPVVYTGFSCMIAGLIMLLCLKPTPRPGAPGEKPQDKEGPTS